MGATYSGGLHVYFGFLRCPGEQGEEDWTKGAQDYLSQRYTGDFQLLDSQEEEGVTILTYQTQDELELVFEVRCWVGGLDTPWGEFHLIPSGSIQKISSSVWTVGSSARLQWM